MLTSLVTGGAGFIGSHVAHHLLKAGHRVVVLDDLSGGSMHHVPKQALFIQGSINNKEIIGQLFNEYQFNYIYHLAAYAAENMSHFIRHFNYQNNVLGSMNLINAAINFNVQCFIFTSSIAVYGQNAQPGIESAIPQPEDPYAIAKYTVELDLMAAHKMFGLNYIIFRPHNVYGKRQNIHDPYRNVIGIFMKQILQGNPLTIFGDGNQTRSFSYIDDIAPYMADAVNKSQAYNQIINIGNDQIYTVNEIAQAVRKIFGQSNPVLHLDARHEVRHAYSHHSKFKKIFAIENKIEKKTETSLMQGLAAMAEWAKNQKITDGSHIQCWNENIEIKKKITRQMAIKWII